MCHCCRISPHLPLFLSLESTLQRAGEGEASRPSRREFQVTLCGTILKITHNCVCQTVPLFKLRFEILRRQRDARNFEAPIANVHRTCEIHCWQNGRKTKTTREVNQTPMDTWSLSITLTRGDFSFWKMTFMLT